MIKNWNCPDDWTIPSINYAGTRTRKQNFIAFSSWLAPGNNDILPQTLFPRIPAVPWPATGLQDSSSLSTALPYTAVLQRHLVLCPSPSPGSQQPVVLSRSWHHQDPEGRTVASHIICNPECLFSAVQQCKDLRKILKFILLSLAFKKWIAVMKKKERKLWWGNIFRLLFFLCFSFLN